MEAAMHPPTLVNALGNVAGLVAFGAFFALLLRGTRGGLSGQRAPLAAAALAILWNLGSVIVLLTDGRLAAIVASVSFAVLSLLPAVLLQLALGREFRQLRTLGYAVGLAAATAHVLEASGLTTGLHQWGIDLSTYGFGALAVVSAIVLARGQSQQRDAAMRTLAAMSLFLLSASFVHFEAQHDPGSWLHEFVFHHAGIPLALFVLLQDYRFLLLDAFVRFLGMVMLAAGFAAALWFILTELGLATAGGVDTMRVTLFLVIATASIVGYPFVRDQLRQWVEKTIFNRGNLGDAIARVRTIDHADEASFLNAAVRTVAGFVSVERWSLEEQSNPSEVRGATTLIDRRPSARPAWAQAAVEIRVAPDQSRTLWLGPRKGGRRYLGSDLRDLNTLAQEIATRMEALRQAEHQRLLSQAELEALRAQINPHFLFNALNAVYGVIPRSASEARHTVLNLADVFRYSLGGRRQIVSLEEELHVAQAYLEIEQLRLGARLAVRIESDREALPIGVPALSLQPLVENAVRHGVSNKAGGGEVLVRTKVEADRLSVIVSDDGPGFDLAAAIRTGHGLYNVRRRLQLCYGSQATFDVHCSENGTQVSFEIPIQRAAEGTLHNAGAKHDNPASVVVDPQG